MMLSDYVFWCFASAVIIGTHDHAHQKRVDLHDIFCNVNKIQLILKACDSVTDYNKRDFSCTVYWLYLHCAYVRYMNFGRVHLR
jgi:hypothetical protein